MFQKDSRAILLLLCTTYYHSTWFLEGRGRLESNASGDGGGGGGVGDVPNVHRFVQWSEKGEDIKTEKYYLLMLEKVNQIVFHYRF